MGKGHNEGGKRGTVPWGPNHRGGADSPRGAPKKPNNVTSTFFNTVHLLRKDLRFEHEGAKFLIVPGAI